MRGDKGITLIALVITIIVMLILVTVSITIAVNGDLFKHAWNAVTRTNTEATNENSLANGKVGDKDIGTLANEYATNAATGN